MAAIELGHLPRKLELEVWLDSGYLGRYEVGRAGDFALQVPLAGVAPGEHTLEIVSNTYLVAHDFVRTRISGRCRSSCEDYGRWRLKR